MSTFFAQPYNIDAVGFYFGDAETYAEQSGSLKDAFGNPVEEFEIQFIDGEDAQLFSACGINQGTLPVWFDSVADLNDLEKAALYYLCGELGYAVDVALDKLGEVSLYEGDLQAAADELFDEIYLDGVPEAVRAYIDYAKFASDCEIGGDMTEFDFNGTTWTCTNSSGM